MHCVLLHIALNLAANSKETGATGGYFK